MTATLWLAWRELRTRKAASVTGIAMVSLVVALCTATELISRAREAAVAGQIDNMGPALRLVPAGRSVRDLARFDLGSTGFAPEETERIARSLSPWTRRLEGRILSKAPLEDGMVPVIGVEPGRVISPFPALNRLGTTEAALGAQLAQRLGKRIGDTIPVAGRRFRIAAVLPETASGEDLAVFLSLRNARDLLGLSHAVNEIRVFSTSGAEIDPIVSRLESDHPEVSVIRVYRGSTAETDIGRSLYQHRRVLYLTMGLVIALCILVWSYLNASERRLEMAMVAAIGGADATVAFMLVLRAAVVGLGGALAGYLGGAAIALLQDFQWASGVVFSWKLLVLVCAGSLAFSILGAIPASIVCAARKHVTVLQEW